MRIFFGVSEGKLEISNMDHADKRVGAFGPNEAEGLVACISELLRKGWDGHAMGSSSMNWSSQYGWPDDNIDGFLRPAIRRAASIVAAEIKAAKPPPPQRPETGTLRFGDDWTGVFVRGDEAVPMSMMLDAVCDAVMNGTQAPKLDLHEVKGFAMLLRRAEEGADPKVVTLRPYPECHPGQRMIDAANDEHVSLNDAVMEFLRLCDHTFTGSPTEAMKALVEVVREKGWAYSRGEVGGDFYEAVRGVSRA